MTDSGIKQAKPFDSGTVFIPKGKLKIKRERGEKKICEFDCFDGSSTPRGKSETFPFPVKCLFNNNTNNNDDEKSYFCTRVTMTSRVKSDFFFFFFFLKK